MNSRAQTTEQASLSMHNSSQATGGSLLRKRSYNGPSVRTLLVTVVVLAVAAGAAGLVSGSTTVLMQALVTGLLTGGIYSLIAMGLTLIYGVLHIINFANGAMVALSMF